MSDDITPTPEDLARPLADDLRLFSDKNHDAATWFRFRGSRVAEHPSAARRFIDMAAVGWPAAIRRAIAAERELAALRAALNAAEREALLLREELSQTAGQHASTGEEDVS